MQSLENCLSYCVDWSKLDALIDESEKKGQTVRQLVGMPILEGYLYKRRKRVEVRTNEEAGFQVAQVLG